MESLLQLTQIQKEKQRKPSVIIILLFLSILAMTTAFIYSNILSGHARKHIRLASELRLDILQIIKFASESENGNHGAFASLFSTQDDFDNTIEGLKSGDTAHDIPTTPEHDHTPLNVVNEQWHEYKKHIKTILGAEKVFRITKEFIKTINNAMPEILDASEEIISELINRRSPPSLIFVASHQLLLAQRITTNVNQIYFRTADFSDKISLLESDTKTFRSALESMLSGDKQTNISRVTSPAVREKIQTLITKFAAVEELITRVKERSATLNKVHQATESILLDSDDLLASIETLINSYEHGGNLPEQIQLAGYALGGLSLVLFMALSFSINRHSRDQLAQEEQINQKTLNTIISLQNEISPIATGDLTVQASVNPGITHSIATAINYTIEALRKLIQNIDQMAHEVSETAEETQATAIHLSRASDHQAQQLTKVTESVNKISKSFELISRQAMESSKLAIEAVAIAEHGGLAVRNTLKGMQTISEDIYDSASQIKRLGESSQEIGDIVELINEIADQTNILALNAAIKASVAGEEAQSFTGVADEVQQLAERVSQATQKIESLVQSIQRDTSQAVVSMEQSSTDVIHGTKLAEAAGEALLRIETVSAHLASHIGEFARATQSLVETSQQVANAMNSIKKVTDHNLAGTKQTASLTGKLAELAREQKSIVKEFKLPT